MYHVAHNHTGNNQNKQASEQKKQKKGLRITTREKKPTLINTSKIEINGEIGIKYYIALEKPILSITKKIEKEIKEKNIF